MRSRLLLLFFVFFGTQGFLSAQQGKNFSYINPKPGSILVSAHTNIIFRHKEFIDESSITTDNITVYGTKSGFHSGELLLSDDGRTIVFNPDIAFELGEKVEVIMEAGLRTTSGDMLDNYKYDFTISTQQIVHDYSYLLNNTEVKTDSQNPASGRIDQTDEELPPPLITINSIDSPSEGYIFMATWDRNVPAEYGNYVFILDNTGEIVDSLRVDGAPFDFRVQDNGLLTYALGGFSSNVPLPGEELKHMVVDEELNPIDSFQMKNGYPTDFHEFIMMPNGHVMMMSYYTITYDMSSIVEGGQTDADLVLNIIQEQDIDKNVVFEWRNIDHIPITDSDLDLTGSRINYSTLNAFDIDTDGNILASFRNHSDIAKISKETGELMWRMGGRQNQFTYIGEHEENAIGIKDGEEIGSPYFHARQHNIQRHANGNITLFDNGEYHDPKYSRAVEYLLDEQNKTATLVSEWRYPTEDIFTATAGNAELLSNGGWFIGFGVPHPQYVTRNAVETHPDGSIALEMTLPMGVLAYRVTKMPWKETVDKRTYVHYEVIEGGDYSFNDDKITTGVELTYNSLVAADYNEAYITRVPYGPAYPEFDDIMKDVMSVSINYDVFSIVEQQTEIRIDLDVYPEILDPENTYIYYRETIGDGKFSRLETTYDAVNNKLVAIITGIGELIFGVPDLTITSLGEVVNEDNILSQNYPNPVIDMTSIAYHIEYPDYVAVIIQNSQGQIIEKLVNKHLNTGSYVVKFDASELRRGIYLYSLQFGNDIISTKKMHVLK